MLKLPLIALLLLAPGDRKCPNPPGEMPGYEWREPVFLVDGLVVSKDEAEKRDLDPEAIASIQITCWDPATDSFALDGIPVVRIETKALVAATREPLLRLIRAQQAFRSRHDRHATDLESLEAVGFDPAVALEFEASGTGWNASTPSGEVAYRCFASEAPATSTGEDGEPQLECGPVDALALRSLRVRYDSGRWNH